MTSLNDGVFPPPKRPLILELAVPASCLATLNLPKSIALPCDLMSMKSMGVQK